MVVGWLGSLLVVGWFVGCMSGRDSYSRVTTIKNRIDMSFSAIEISTHAELDLIICPLDLFSP